MELYLVKDAVKITQVSKAFSKTNEYNRYINKDNRHNYYEYNCYKIYDPDANAPSEPEDDDERTLLTISDLPVVFRSICSDADDASEHSERFAERVEMKLKSQAENRKFGNLKLELVISNDPLEGYFLLSSETTEGSKINVLKGMYHDLRPGDLEFILEVSLCHLSTVNDTVAPESLVFLKSGKISNCSLNERVGSCVPVRIPQELKQWAGEQGTGFIYSKSRIKVILNENAVNWAFECSSRNEGLLGLNSPFADLEIECKSGEILNCHRAILADKSDVLWGKLKDMLERKKRGPWKLKMEMSVEAVMAFLEYVYCGNVSGGMGRCDVALELLKAGWEYDMEGLRNAMEGIIMAKGSTDLEFFGVGSAVELYLFAGKYGKEMKYLRDKALCVLRNVSETASDKLVESEENQDLLENQPWPSWVKSFPWQRLQRALPLLMFSVFLGMKYWRGRGGFYN